MRAVIYARYSSDLQDSRSIADQVSLCRALAQKLGAEVVEVYSDAEISGSHLATRPGILKLLADARAGRFDLVLAEALDRLSRDMEHTSGLSKRLAYAGVRIWTSEEGEVGDVHVAVKSIVNALYLKTLAAKVRRGQRGRAEQGLVAGGRAYGYRVVRALDARGEPVRGKREIDPVEANVVRRIFEAYAAGASPRAIAAELNAERIPAPQGGLWSASTLYGSRQRKRGILENEAYIGRLTWNRSSIAKDPDTGRRLARLNAATEHLVREVPELRIVGEELWQRVRKRKERASSRPAHLQRQPRRLLSGLVRCALCGGPMVIRTKDRLCCSRHYQSGACTNGRTIRIADVERRVFAALPGALDDSERVEAFVKEYHAERLRLAQSGAKRRDKVQRRLGEIDRNLKRLVDEICEGRGGNAVHQAIVALEREQEELRHELAALKPPAEPVITLHPGILAERRKALEELGTALRDDPVARAEASQLLRRVIASIEIHPLEDGRTGIIVHGVLSTLLGIESGTEGTVHPGKLAEGTGFRRYSPVIAIAC